VKFFDFLDARNFQLEMRRHPVEGRWSVCMKDVWMVCMDGHGQGTLTGHGDTPNTAIHDLAQTAQGQSLLIRSGTPGEEIFLAPKVLET
jgi:hypothetical protein